MFLVGRQIVKINVWGSRPGDASSSLLRLRPCLDLRGVPSFEDPATANGLKGEPVDKWQNNNYNLHNEHNTWWFNRTASRTSKTIPTNW